MTEAYKTQAARAALELVEPGMVVGLGSGSTSAKFVQALGERVRDGLEVVGVPTSEAIRELAEKLGIGLTTLDEVARLDLTVDGADEIDPELRLIKGGGGAHLREKIVALASRSMVVIADHTKLVDQLGAFPLPIEVVPFGLKATTWMISEAAAEVGCVPSAPLTPRLGSDGQPVLTDGGHLLIDAAFGKIPDPDGLSDLLEMIPGIVDHGLFIDIAESAIIATPDGLQVLTAD